MLKKLANAQKEHMEKHQAKQDATNEKIETKMMEKYGDTIDALLMDGEEVVKVYGLLRDFACITTERLIFVDKQGVSGTKTEIISVFFRHIQEVKIESGFISGEVTVCTSSREYEMQMADKNMTAQFAKQLMTSMR